MSGGDLGRAMNFDRADLAANRDGAISPAQAMRMRQDQRRTALFAALTCIVLALIATILLYIGQSAQNTIASLAGVGLTLFNALLVGYAGRAVMRLGGDLRLGDVEALTGQVERILRRGRQSDNFRLRIAGVDLPITKEVFLCFRHKQPYRVYRARHSRRLLSAERLEGDAPTPAA